MRWVLRSLAAAAALVVIGASVVVLVARQRLPRVAGSARLPGLEAPVTIRRDELGVPHIEAVHELDAWAAVGFVHAQDRFFQMDLARRVVSGRLSEIVGEAALPVDRENLTLQMVPTARVQLEELPADARAILEAYARGVDAGLADTGPPVECVLLRYEPASWTPLDTLLVLKYMENLLAPDGGEKRRARMAAALGGDVAAFLFDFQGMVGATILPPDAESVPSMPLPPPTDPPDPGPPPAEAPADLRRGSNAWAVAGRRTTSGLPLLANDTHLATGVPPIWYQAHVRFPGVDTVGMTIAGEPFPIVGHNGRVAWGITTLMADQVDFVRLALDPADPDRFRHGDGDGWERLQIRRETIPVAGRAPERLDVRWSRFGPVVERWGTTAFARQWTVYHESRTMVAGRAFLSAGTVPDLLEAARDFTSPGSSIVAADVSGHIGFAAAGSIPLRAGGDGTLPGDGRRDDAGWVGIVPAGEAPTLLDPPAGWVVTANNRIGRGPRAMRIARRWAQPFRADRIIERIEAVRAHDVASMEAIQLDTVSPFARRLLGALPAGPLADPAVNAGWQKLRAWNGRFDRGTSPALFELFARELQRSVFEDEAGTFWVDALPGLLKVTGAGRFEEVPSDMLVRDWFDDRRTPARERPAQIVERALSAAITSLRARFGRDPNAWGWERVHSVTFPHPLGRVPALARVFDLGPFPVRGSHTTVCAAAGEPDDPFSVTQIPVFRMVVDLGDLRRSRIVNSVGQSGHLLSPHYGDQIGRWLRGESTPMLWAPDDVEAHTAATLVLR